MNKFLNTRRRCLNPWILGLIVIAIIGLIIFIPIVGFATLLVALPFIVCAIMCGSMVFMMGKTPKKE